MIITFEGNASLESWWGTLLGPKVSFLGLKRATYAHIRVAVMACNKSPMLDFFFSPASTHSTFSITSTFAHMFDSMLDVR